MAGKRELDPIKGQWPNPNTIACKDCVHRDRTEIDIDGRVIKVGITRAYCEAYPPRPASNGKPHVILFQNAECKYYQKEIE